MSEERVFGIKIIEGGVWLSLAAVLARFVGLATTILILTRLSVKEYGTYQLVLAAFGFLASFFISGLDPLITNDLARDRGEEKFERVKKLFLEYGVFKMATGLGLFLVTFLGSSWISRWYSPEAGQFLKTISFLFVLMAIERMLNLLLNINLKFRLMSLFTIIEESAKLGWVLILVWWFGRGVGGLVSASVLATATTLLLFLPKGLKLVKDLLVYPNLKEFVLWSMAKAHGKWGIATNYFHEIEKSIRPWMIKAFLGIEAVGLYALAEGIYGQIGSFVPVANLLAPLVPQEINNKDRIRNLLLYGIKYGTVFFVLMGLGSFFAVPILLQWFFPKYLAAVSIFRIMLFTFLTTASANILNTIFYSYREQKTIFLLLILRVIFLLVASTVLISVLGIIGVAIEFVLTAVFSVASRYHSLKKIAPDLYLPLKTFLRFDTGDKTFFKRFGEYIKFYLRGLTIRRNIA